MKKITLLTSIFFFSFMVSGHILQVKAAKFHFNPSSAVLKQTCITTVNIDVDPEGAASNAAEAIINYNPSEIEIIDQDSDSPGIQIRGGNAYQNYIYNVADASNGRITLAGASFTTLLQSRRVFAIIQFRSQPSITTTNFTIQYSGFGVTNDSNIADSTTNLDLLNGVTNASYTFEVANCQTSTSAPQVEFLNITNGQTDVPLNSDVVIRVTDGLVDIDLDSIVVMVNGNTYTIQDPELTYNGSNGNYTFTLNPSIDFPDNEAVIVSIRGRNVSGIQFYDHIIFNTPGAPALECTNIIDTTNITDVNELFTAFDTFGANVFEGTLFEGVTKNIGSAGIISVSGLILSGLSLLSFIYLLTTPGALLKLIAILWGKKVKKPWGVVTDSRTGKAIAFAVCELYTAGSQYRISQTVTDLDGRYGFVITAGDYRLEIRQSGYRKFEQNITINEGQQGFVYDVDMVPLGSTKPAIAKSDSIKIKLYTIFDKIASYMFVIGFSFSIFALIFSLSLVNLFIFSIYVLIICALILISVRKRRSISSVINAENNLRIPYAKVKLFDAKTGKMVDAQVSNYNGYFDFYCDPGEYALMVSSRGYQFPSKRNQYKLTKNKKMIVVNIKKGRNQINVYVDPIKFDSVKQNGDNLYSPFN